MQLTRPIKFLQRCNTSTS